LRALRWQVLEDFPRHFGVMPDAVGRMANLLRLTYPNWQTDRCDAVAQYFRLHDVPTTIQPDELLPPTWDQYDWTELASHTIGAVRDFAYMKWRYAEHPCFAYRFLAVGEGKRTGLAVWRLETIRIATSQGLEEVDRIGRLLEFLPVSRGNAKHLFTAFFHEVQKANALAADFYGYYGRTRLWLNECGFQEVNAHHDGHAIPTRFQPLDNKGGTILNAVFSKVAGPTCSADADCLWYWTKSDGDQDRPN